MTISLSTVHVIVDDPDAALAFYRDTLGLKVTNEVPYEGFKWITLVTDSQPEVAIVLSQPHAGRSQEDGDRLAAMPEVVDQVALARLSRGRINEFMFQQYVVVARREVGAPSDT